MSKFTSTPGQPHRVAPTITRNSRTTEGVDADGSPPRLLWLNPARKWGGGQNDFHDAGLGVETEAAGRA